MLCETVMTPVDPIQLNIAGLVTRLCVDDAALARRVRQRYAAFVDRSNAPVAMTVQVESMGNFRPITPQPGTNWITHLTRHDGILHYESYLQRGTIDFAQRSARLQIDETANLENFLRVVYAWLALQADGVLLHAAGVIRNGHGYVFFGPSGAGKTTVSRLSQAVGNVVSDDLVIVRRIDGVYRLCGVPFRGELSDAPRTNADAPLRTLLRLHQQHQHQATPLPAPQAAAQLAASAPFVVSGMGLGQLLLNRCLHLARHVPVQQLHFKRDLGFWEVICDDFAAVS
jgi:hypothetical protein